MIVNMSKPLFFCPCSWQASNTLGGLSHQTLGQGETAPQHAAGLHQLAGCQEKGGAAHQPGQRPLGILAWDHLHSGWAEETKRWTQGWSPVADFMNTSDICSLKLMVCKQRATNYLVINKISSPFRSFWKSYSSGRVRWMKPMPLLTNCWPCMPMTTHTRSHKSTTTWWQPGHTSASGNAASQWPHTV